MNSRGLIWAGLWLVLFVISSAIVFGGGREKSFDYWHGRENTPGWGDMHDWNGVFPWRGHHYWQDDGEEDGKGWPNRFGMMDGDGWGHMQGCGNWLPQNLTDEQQSIVRELMEAASVENRKLQHQRNTVHEKLQKLYSSEKHDWAAIRAATNELMSIQSKLLGMVIDMQQKIEAMQNSPADTVKK